MAADAYPHPLADFVCQGESKDLHSYFEQSIQNLLKESSEKFKGWLSTPGPLNTELSCKKVSATAHGASSPAARAALPPPPIPSHAPPSQRLCWCCSTVVRPLGKASRGSQDSRLTLLLGPGRLGTGTLCACGRSPRRSRRLPHWCCTGCSGSGTCGTRTCCRAKWWRPWTRTWRFITT